MNLEANPGEAMTIADMKARYAGESVERVSRYLSELASAGFIEKVEYGVYRYNP
ncbi:putative transcriptional regulator [Leifsonia sp. 1010]|nr:putative transcriptional regulator [Leifsonia sp. 1010]